MKSSKETGSSFEAIASSYLEGKGYSILKRNYTTPYGETDIIALDGQTTVFVEVKSAVGYDPLEAVHAGKVRKIRNAALHYMQGLGREITVRFDVITITKGGQDIRHLIDAF